MEAKSVVRLRERKKTEEDTYIGEAIKKFITEGDQMARVMEQMQDSQTQKLQLKTQLLNSFTRHMDIVRIPRKNELTK